MDFGSSSPLDEVVQEQFNGRPIIALHIRDGLYKRSTFSDMYFAHEEEDFRDITAVNYVPMVEHAIAQGYAVIRVGNSAMHRLPVQSDFFLDYPFSSFVSPVNDLRVIGMSSAYAAGGDSGLLSVALLMRKPMFLSNAIVQRVPINAAPALTIFRPHIRASTGVPWRLSELSQALSRSNLNPQFGSEFIGLDIQFRENTPVEIVNAFKEFLAVLQNPSTATKAVTPGEKLFWYHYARGPLFSSAPRRMRIGGDFLANNPCWTT
jgi:putative glycosyltransferase (TIGR04372 family)